MEPRMESSTYFLNKSEQCRRLAAAIVTARDNPAVAPILALSAEFEARAIASAMRETDALMARSQLSKPNGANGKLRG
jgi:hypothetical protein